MKLTPSRAFEIWKKLQEAKAESEKVPSIHGKVSEVSVSKDQDVFVFVNVGRKSSIFRTTQKVRETYPTFKVVGLQRKRKPGGYFVLHVQPGRAVIELKQHPICVGEGKIKLVP